MVVAWDVSGSFSWVIRVRIGSIESPFHRDPRCASRMSCNAHVSMKTRKFARKSRSNLSDITGGYKYILSLFQFSPYSTIIPWYHSTLEVHLAQWTCVSLMCQVFKRQHRSDIDLADIALSPNPIIPSSLLTSQALLLLRSRRFSVVYRRWRVTRAALPPLSDDMPDKDQRSTPLSINSSVFPRPILILLDYFILAPHVIFSHSCTCVSLFPHLIK